MVERRGRLWLAVLPAMVVPFVASLFYFVVFKDSLIARVSYGATKIFTVVWPALAVWLILRERLPRLAVEREHARAVPFGAVSGATIVLLMFGLMLTPVGDVVASGALNIRDKAKTFGIVRYYWTFALGLSVFHSLLEEYYWRWFVYGRLRRLTRSGPAHLLAGLAFAAHHVVIATQYFPFGWGLVFGGLVAGGGVIWSMLYEQQATLVGAWVSHLIVDLGIMAVGHRLLFGSYL